MPTCNQCKVNLRGKLNNNLCKNCFTNENTATSQDKVIDLNTLTGDYLNKPLVDLTVGDLVAIIKAVNGDYEEKLTTLVNRISTLEQSVDALKKEDSRKDEILLNHQRFLEVLANKDRQCNLIISGVKESGVQDAEQSNDERTVKDIVSRISGTLSVDGLKFEIERLGDVDKAHKPRPIRVKVETAKIRNELCAQSSLLKNIEGFQNIYVKRDTHPAIRKENSRIYKLVKEEKERPENQGHNIIYDRKAKVVLRDDVIIDRFNPHF